MAELADAQDSDSCEGIPLVGSSPIVRSLPNKSIF